jgi:hypothetical protein
MLSQKDVREQRVRRIMIALEQICSRLASQSGSAGRPLRSGVTGFLDEFPDGLIEFLIVKGARE